MKDCPDSPSGMHARDDSGKCVWCKPSKLLPMLNPQATVEATARRLGITYNPWAGSPAEIRSRAFRPKRSGGEGR